MVERKPAMDDSELLQQYLQAGSAGAFAQLMSRHINMVYAAARRQVSDPHLADDVTQAVFLLLSQKAKKVHGGAGLPGWLLITTHYVARHARKIEHRRRAHEQRAAEMADQRTMKSKDTSWQEVYPELDAALARLNPKDRSIVALHFMEGRTFREVGTTLGISEDAARLASARAVQKLRQNLSKQGASVSTAALGSMIATHGLVTAPAGLTHTISATTILGAAKSSSTVLLLAQKAALSMKLKAALMTNSIIAAILLGGAAATIALMHLGGPGHSASFADSAGSGAANAKTVVAKFDSGGNIELVGIAKYPGVTTSWWMGGPQWWGPDGTPLPISLGSPMLPAPIDPNSETRQLYQFAFRVSNMQINPHDFSLFAMGEPDGSQGVYFQSNGDGKSGILYATALLYPEQAATNVCIRLSTDPYEHVTIDAQGRSDASNDPVAHGFFPVKIGEKDGLTYISSHGEPTYDLHVTAQASDGATFFPAAHAPRFIGQEGDNSAMGVFCFAVPHQSIAGYQLDIRRCRDWVTFRRVSLRPEMTSMPFAENRYQLWEPNLIDYNRPVKDLLAKLVASIRKSEATQAYTLCQQLSDEIQSRAPSVRGTPSEYQVIEGEPVLAQLQQALSQGDMSTAMSLVDSGNGKGHRICHMVNTLGGVPKTNTGSQ